MAVSKLPSPPAARRVNVSTLFAGGSLPAGIGNSCAMPGQHAGSNQCDCGNQEMTYDFDFVLSSFAGPFCFCKAPTDAPANSLYESPLAAYCEPPVGVPEQINLQLAASDVFVVGFVTYEAFPPALPVAMLGEEGGGPMRRILGVSHEFIMPNGHVLPGRGKRKGSHINTSSFRNQPVSGY
jgi:hypothetical protein